MSVFASETSVTLPLPGTADQTITIRKFSRREYRRVIEQPNDELWRVVILGLPEIKDGDTVVQRAVEPGLIAWSFDKPINAESVDDLDTEASIFISDEIIFLARPTLRPDPKAKTAEEAVEGEQKKD